MSCYSPSHHQFIFVCPSVYRLLPCSWWHCSRGFTLPATINVSGESVGYLVLAKTSRVSVVIPAMMENWNRSRDTHTVIIFGFLFIILECFTIQWCILHIFFLNTHRVDKVLDSSFNFPTLFRQTWCSSGKLHDKSTQRGTYLQLINAGMHSKRVPKNLKDNQCIFSRLWLKKCRGSCTSVLGFPLTRKNSLLWATIPVFKRVNLLEANWKASDSSKLQYETDASITFWGTRLFSGLVWRNQ